MVKQLREMVGQPWTANRYPPVTDELFAEIVRRIRSVGSPLKIVLFGSRALGTARLDSDIDLMVVEERDKDCDAMMRSYRDALSGLFPEFNVFVRSTTEVAEWRNVPNHMITEALSYGRPLFDDKEKIADLHGHAVPSLDRSGSLWVREEVEPKTECDLAKHWLGLGDDDMDMGRLVISQREGSRVKLAYACYFAQQAIEKYFKGLLMLHGHSVPRTHDLVDLYERSCAHADLSQLSTIDFKTISDFYITARYTVTCRPSESEVENLLGLAEMVRRAVLSVVPLEARP